MPKRPVAQYVGTLDRWLEEGVGLVRGLHWIERVIITDREPSTRPDGAAGWTTRSDFLGEMTGDWVVSATAELPLAIVRYMPWPSTSLDFEHMSFPSREAALDALSTGCLEWAYLSPQEGLREKLLARRREIHGGDLT